MHIAIMACDQFNILHTCALICRDSHSFRQKYVNLSLPNCSCLGDLSPNYPCGEYVNGSDAVVRNLTVNARLAANKVQALIRNVSSAIAMQNHSFQLPPAAVLSTWAEQAKPTLSMVFSGPPGLIHYSCTVHQDAHTGTCGDPCPDQCCWANDPCCCNGPVIWPQPCMVLLYPPGLAVPSSTFERDNGL